MEQPLRWHRIVAEREPERLVFLALYREVAADVIARSSAPAVAAPFWPPGLQRNGSSSAG
jgi:hypothetical protein